MPTTSHLEIQLLGSFRLIYQGKILTTFGQARLQALLTYLLLHRDAPQPRQFLSFTFWPNSTESQARTNLRQLVYHLQRALPDADHYLKVDPTTIQWQSKAAFRLDTAEFQADVNLAQQAMQAGMTASARERLESAVQRYRGELLPGCYEEWILPERERLRQTFLLSLETLLHQVEAKKEYRIAISYANTLLQHDPLRETTYQHLMRLYALAGDRASALHVYHTCVQVLDRELGVEPNPATQGDYRNLLDVPIQSPTESGNLNESPAHTPLVGREQEWQVLQAAWHRAIAGQTGMVMVAGEAGMGKTRLAEEMLDWATHHSITVGKTRSYAAEGQLAFASVAEILRSEPFFSRLLEMDSVWQSELARIIPELRVYRVELPKPEPMTESWQRKRLFEALGRAIFTVPEPLLLFFDDLQWCDQDTLEWLHFLLHFQEKARLLILTVVRSEEVDPAHPLVPMVLDLRSREKIIELELGPLDKTQTTVLAEQLDGKQIEPARAARLYEHSEGNPLFLIELVRAEGTLGHPEASAGELLPPWDRAFTLDRELGVTRGIHIPARIYTIIQNRLRQLSPAARELASLGATIGRAFSLEVLLPASEMDEEDILQGLDELWSRRIVREQGSSGYDFSHDRIREVAYLETSPVKRAMLHRRIARTLEKLNPEQLDAYSSQIASHYEQAGALEPALAYYQRAAAAAQSTFSYGEVISLLNKALEILPQLSRSAAQEQTELELLINLGTACMLTRGYAHLDVERALLRAWQIVNRLDKSPQLIPVLAGLWLHYHVRGDIPQQVLWAGRLESELNNQPAEQFLPVIYFALTGTAFLKGDFVAANQYSATGYAFFSANRQGSQSMLYGYEPEMALIAYWAWTLWALGYPDQARRRAEQALAEAETSRHPANTILGMCQGLILHQLCREVAPIFQQAAKIIAYATEQMIPYWVTLVQMFRGWALAQDGQVNLGIEELKQGIDAWETMGAGMGMTQYLGLLAESYRLSGDRDQGLAALDKAFALVGAGKESWYEAELYRQQGELLLTEMGNEPEAEACFQRALETASRQQARSFELRAALSLSCLWQKQGRREEAYQLLVGVYNWFSEGFDTPDLRQAKALLAALRRDGI